MWLLKKYGAGFFSRWSRTSLQTGALSAGTFSADLATALAQWDNAPFHLYGYLYLVGSTPNMTHIGRTVFFASISFWRDHFCFVVQPKCTALGAFLAIIPLKHYFQPALTLWVSKLFCGHTNLFVLRSARCKLAFLSIILDLLVTLKAIHELPGVHRPSLAYWQLLHWSGCGAAETGVPGMLTGQLHCVSEHPTSGLVLQKLTEVPMRDLYKTVYALAIE